MTWPLQPIGPRPTGVPRVDPVGRAAPPDRRRERGEDEARKDGEEHARQDGGGLPRPDEDGHIDVLA